MRYLILANETPAAFDERNDADRADAYWTSWRDYIDALQDSGLLRDAAGLEPPWTASTVRVRDGKRLVQDGPFPDSKESLGGYFVIEAEDLDAALEWAARCPSAAYSAVEVRPVLPMGPA